MRTNALRYTAAFIFVFAFALSLAVTGSEVTAAQCPPCDCYRQCVEIQPGWFDSGVCKDRCFVGQGGGASCPSYCP